MRETIWMVVSIVVALASIVLGISETTSTIYSMNDAFDGSGRFHSSTARRRLPTMNSPDYFDLLRLQVQEAVDSGDESFVTVVNEPNSSLYQVTLFPDYNATTFRLAEIKAFIAFSTDTLEYISGKSNDGFAVLLAIHHFNNMFESNYHPVLGALDDAWKSCNVRLTAELFDSTTSPTTATQTIVEMLGRETSIAMPSTTAVVASCPTTTTLPLSILTGIESVPLVSASATSAGFDDKEQFPLFGRTVTAAAGEAAVALQFFQSIHSTHVAILFVTVRARNITCDDLLAAHISTVLFI
jgi:Receptor family ligand binding region